MKKFIKVISIILLVLIAIYLIAIPIFSKKIELQENVYFSPTKYNEDSIVKNISLIHIDYIKKDSILKLTERIVLTDNENIMTFDSVLLSRKFIHLNDSTKAEYFVFQPKNSKKTGIFFMGNGFDIFKVTDKLFELANKTNAAIYVLNYRGYGKSTGNSTFERQFKDNQNFLDSLKNKNIKVDFIIGHSLGTVFSTYLATNNQIPQLYLLAPFSNAGDLIDYAKKLSFPGIYKLAQPFYKIEVADKFLSTISSSEKLNYYGLKTHRL